MLLETLRYLALGRQAHLDGHSLDSIVDMASFICYSLDFTPHGSNAIPHDSIDQVKRIEKRTFPKNEAMDFDAELKKSNTELVLIIADADDDHQAPVVGYMLSARNHGVTLLHKICVVEGYQRRGLAKTMIRKLVTRVESQGCERIQLWVDFQNAAAISLYASLGFKDYDRSRDYYGPNRHGLQMIQELNYVW